MCTCSVALRPRFARSSSSRAPTARGQTSAYKLARGPRTLFFSILPQKIWVPTEKPTFRTFSWTRPLIGRIPGLQRPCGNLMEAPRHRKWACRASALGLSAMFTRTTVGCALVGYAGAFSGMSPLALKPTSASTSALRLRAAGPSMKIGVFFGTSTGNTESVATRVS